MKLLLPRHKSTSVLWQLPRNEFQKLCSQCSSLAEILRHFGLHEGAGNYKTLKRRIQKDTINIKHIPLGMGSNKNRGRGGPKAFPLNKVLVNNATHRVNNQKIKRRLIAENRLVPECSECGIGEWWNGKPMVLRLDHQNGNARDYRFENLRLLCPNCDSQQPTFAGRNVRQKMPVSAMG